MLMRAILLLNGGSVKTWKLVLWVGERDNVVYWKTNGKINFDLQCSMGGRIGLEMVV